MHFTKVTLCAATLALGIASAASSYTITVPKALSIGETKINAGQYKLEVEGNQAIFKHGKESIPVPVTVEKTASTIRDTKIETESTRLRAINVGGTNLRIVFTDKAATSAIE